MFALLSYLRETKAAVRHTEDIHVTLLKNFPSQPGQYRFKPHNLLPWMQVQVVKQSVLAPDTFRVRCAGLTFNPSGVFASGVWQGPL